MPAIVEFTLPISDRSDPILVPNTRSGGVALNGVEQIVSPLTATWKWKIAFPINNIGRARSWRAIQAQLEGRFGYLRTRICDQYRIGRNAVGAWSALNPIPHSDDAFFSDFSGYALAQPQSEVQASAGRGATSLRIMASDLNGAMSAGVFFSVNDWLYVATDWQLAGNAEEFIDIQFKPPLRTAVTAGDMVDFDAKAIWNADTDDAGRLQLRLGRFGEVELNLTEALGRSV